MGLDKCSLTVVYLPSDEKAVPQWAVTWWQTALLREVSKLSCDLLYFHVSATETLSPVAWVLNRFEKFVQHFSQKSRRGHFESTTFVVSHLIGVLLWHKTSKVNLWWIIIIVNLPIFVTTVYSSRLKDTLNCCQDGYKKSESGYDAIRSG